MLDKVNVRVRPKPCRILRQFLMKPKDTVPIEEQTGVVYRVMCKECPKTYVGQSGRTLECWMKEHRRVTEKGNMDSSAIAEHTWKFYYRVNWEEVEVLDQQSYGRCMLEILSLSLSIQYFITHFAPPTFCIYKYCNHHLNFIP